MKALAVITARGGSKRLPRKNIRLFCGKPIIAYSIEAALRSKCFDTVMCSTDDMEIAEIAVKYGAQVPFMRSEATSNDFATTSDVLCEVIDEYQKRSITFDYLCCLYPTAPFINPERLQKGWEMVSQQNAQGAIPLVKYSHPIQRAIRIENNTIAMADPSQAAKRTQDLEAYYHDIGQYYWLNTQIFRQTPQIMLLKLLPIITPESEAQDIDTEEDWKIAELKYQLLHASN